MSLPVRAPVALLAVAGVALLSAGCRSGEAPRRAALRELVETVATGEQAAAAGAEDRLVETLVVPLVSAIGSLDQRPIEQQVRLRAALVRIERELRLQVVRLDLPPEDRRLVDEFARRHPGLTRELFDASYRVRLAAVRRVPLEPDSGAGVLLAAKVNDDDEDVIHAALQRAARLHDRVVARNLVRYVAGATAAVESGYFGAENRDLAGAVATIVFKSIRVIGLCGWRAGAPTVRAALDYFGHSPCWDIHQRAETIRILGELGDRSVAPSLYAFIDDPSPHRWRYEADDTRAGQTVGDAALFALCRLYDLQPQRFGLLTAEDDPTFAGYRRDKHRQAGHAAFRRWYQRERPAAASRPRSPANGKQP